MIRTYLDTNILIAAYNSDNTHHAQALELIGDTRRRFVASRLISLELLPHTVYHEEERASRFYGAILEEGISEFKMVDEGLISLALSVAERTNARALDALHLAAAISLGADEFVTTEKRTKPMYRETRVRVLHLDDVTTA